MGKEPFVRQPNESNIGEVARRVFNKKIEEMTPEEVLLEIERLKKFFQELLNDTAIDGSDKAFKDYQNIDGFPESITLPDGSLVEPQTSTEWIDEKSSSKGPKK